MMYHNYVFFTLDKGVRAIPKKQLDKDKLAFIKELSKEKDLLTYAYSLLGLKGDIVFLLWFQSNSLEQIQNVLNKLMHTSLGQYLRISQTLFGIARTTQYSPETVNHLETRRKVG